MPTYVPKKNEVTPKWYIVDAEGIALGRVATQVATLLRGKHRPTYTPYLDSGDHVIVLNAAKIQWTGNKLEQKVYRHYTGYPVRGRPRAVPGLRRGRMIRRIHHRWSSACLRRGISRY